MSYLITDDWQFQIGNFLIGDCVVSCVVSVEGLGDPAPKSRDIDLDMSPGVVLGPDLASPRVLTLNIVTKADDSQQDTALRASQAIARAQSVWAAWVASSSDKTLYGRLPGLGSFNVIGRTRGATMDISKAYLGVVDMQLTFVSPTTVINW